MAKKVITIKVPKSVFKTWMKFENWRNHIRISRWAKKNNIHTGTRQILRNGVWEDQSHNLYNCLGQKVGKIEWIRQGEGS